MLFPRRKKRYDFENKVSKLCRIQKQKRLRKEKCAFPAGKSNYDGERAEGSMTLEAAFVLPLFLFAMLAILQFAKIETVSIALLAGMQDTAKDMAAYAYIKEIGVSAGDSATGELLSGGISAVYAKNSVEKKANLKSSDGSISLWKSSFIENEMIDLAVTYEAQNTYTILPVPKVKAALRTRVRAWTGRDGNGSSIQGEDQEETEKEEMVYVTTTGTVYHKDENCTHIKLSIKTVSLEQAKGLRNKSGGKYHACERCGRGAEGSVYITEYGDRYHSSLGCSGLKRSVVKIPLSQAKDRRACSKCSGSG